MIAGHNQLVTVINAVTDGSVDAEGRLITTWVEQAPVPGNVFERSARQLRDGLLVVTAEWKALLPAGTVVNSDDVIRDSAGVERQVDAARSRLGPGGTEYFVSCDLRAERS